jgi:hypothetical protein
MMVKQNININDYFDKISRIIVDYCIENDIISKQRRIFIIYL